MFQKHWLLLGILIVGAVVLYMILRNPTQKALITAGNPTFGPRSTPTLSGVWNNIADAFGSLFGRTDAPHSATDPGGYGENEFAD